MITIKDVANRANVSTATASRALRKLGYISKETYDRIIRAANELGYVANSTAQQLKTNSVKTVGFIISDINNEYYFSILSSLQARLSELGINLLIAFSSENPQDECNSFRSLIASRVSAILFIPTNNRNKAIIDIARQNEIKVIQLFRNIYDDIDSIINDDESGCCAAARHLLDMNCKKLLLLDVDYKYLNFNDVSPNRSIGFMRALENSDARMHILNFPLVDYNLSVLYNAIATFRPDGIITATNKFGFEALTYLKAHPELCSPKLISFDDNMWLEYSAISAVKQDTEILTETICKLIGERGEVKKEKIPQTLIVRE